MKTEARNTSALFCLFSRSDSVHISLSFSSSFCCQPAFTLKVLQLLLFNLKSCSMLMSSVPLTCMIVVVTIINVVITIVGCVITGSCCRHLEPRAAFKAVVQFLTLCLKLTADELGPVGIPLFTFHLEPEEAAGRRLGGQEDWSRRSGGDVFVLVVVSVAQPVVSQLFSLQLASF